MTVKRKLSITSGVFFSALFSLALLAYHDGPEPGHTAGPGEEPNGCAKATCHVGTGNPVKDSGIELETTESGTYTPGVKQHWTVKVTGQGANGAAQVFGFQASVRGSDNAQAGTFASTDARTLILCQSGSQNLPCPEAAPMMYISHRLANSSNTFEFDWTPPATDRGTITVYLAANAANGNGQETSDRIYLRQFTLTPKAGGGSTTSIDSVQQVWSEAKTLSPGTWAYIKGTNLSPTTREWLGSDFQGTQAPTEVSTVKVKVGGKSAFISYVSPTQVNFQVPDGIGVGDGIQLELESSAGSAKTTIKGAAVSPGLLTTPIFNVGGKQYVAALHPDLRTFVGRENLVQGAAFRPAKPGDKIIIYAVGCGPTSPESPAGQIITGIRRLSSTVQVQFGETVATADSFMEPNLVGLCRIDATVPDVANGDVSLKVTVNGVADGQSLFTTVQR